jgi:hypothetical protein
MITGKMLALWKVGSFALEMGRGARRTSWMETEGFNVVRPEPLCECEGEEHVGGFGLSVCLPWIVCFPVLFQWSASQ